MFCFKPGSFYMLSRCSSTVPQPPPTTGIVLQGTYTTDFGVIGTKILYYCCSIEWIFQQVSILYQMGTEAALEI